MAPAEHLEPEAASATTTGTARRITGSRGPGTTARDPRAPGTD